jgi:hypothetical protein
MAECVHTAMDSVQPARQHTMAYVVLAKPCRS